MWKFLTAAMAELRVLHKYTATKVRNESLPDLPKNPP